MRSLFSLLLAVCLLTLSWGNRTKRVGGTVDIVVHTRIAVAVKGMEWNATKHRHEAVFAVSVTIDPPGQIPSGYVAHYAWSGDGLEFDDPLAASTTARAPATGIYYPGCAVHATKAGSGISYDGTEASECAAIGGPITVSVGGNSEPTFSHDGNDRTKSWYLTHYGYSHAAPTPAYAENTHRATMKVDGQPTITRNGILRGTTITWTLPESTHTNDPKTTGFATNGSIVSQPLTVLVGAEGAFKDGVPKVHFHFDDGVISGDADDDSAEAQVSQGTAPNVSWVPLVYKVSGHVPKNLVRALPATSDQTFTPPPGATYWTNKARIKYLLKDTDGAAMPGVWIQERFTDNNRLHLVINGYGATAGSPHTNTYKWITLRVSALDSGSIAATDGIFNDFDTLWYFGWSANDPPGTEAKTTHSYYAGTSDATYVATTGVPLGAYAIKFVAGTPGTATQTDPPSTP